MNVSHNCSSAVAFESWLGIVSGRELPMDFVKLSRSSGSNVSFGASPLTDNVHFRQALDPSIFHFEHEWHRSSPHTLQ